MKTLYKAIKKQSDSVTDQELMALIKHDPLQLIELDGFSSQKDCIKFYDEHEDRIQKMMIDVAEDLGEKNWMVMIENSDFFGLLKVVNGFKVLMTYEALTGVGIWLFEQYKKKVTKLLIKDGLSNADVKEMVFHDFEYVLKTYPDATVKKLAERIKELSPPSLKAE